VVLDCDCKFETGNHECGTKIAICYNANHSKLSKPDNSPW